MSRARGSKIEITKNAKQKQTAKKKLTTKHTNKVTTEKLILQKVFRQFLLSWYPHTKITKPNHVVVVSARLFSPSRDGQRSNGFEIFSSTLI